MAATKQFWYISLYCSSKEFLYFLAHLVSTQVSSVFYSCLILFNTLDRKNRYAYITEPSTTVTTTSTSKKINSQGFPQNILNPYLSTQIQEWAYKTELHIYSTLYKLSTFVFRIISPNTTNLVFQKDFIHNHFKLMGLNVSWLLVLHLVEQLPGMNYRALPGL